MEVAATLLRVRAPPVLGQEMLQHGEQEGAKFAFAAVRGAEVILFQQAGEEFLRQILSVMRLVAASANERVKRPPVSAAQFRQRFGSLRSITLPGGQNDAPMGRRKSCGALRSEERRVGKE